MPGTENEAAAAAIDAVSERLGALRSKLVANPTARRTPESWTAWNELCHLAARSNEVPRFVALAEPRPNTPRPTINIDEINQGQSDAREGKSADEVLDEALASLAEAKKTVLGLDEDILNRTYNDFRTGAERRVGEGLKMIYQNHYGTHIQQIEEALANPV